MTLFSNSPSPSPPSPGPGRCPPRQRSPSVQSQRCSAPRRAHALRLKNQIREHLRGNEGRSQEILVHQSQATWCSESGRSPLTRPSTTTTTKKTCNVSHEWTTRQTEFCMPGLICLSENHITTTASVISSHLNLYS